MKFVHFVALFQTPYTGGQVRFGVSSDRYKLYLGNNMQDYNALYTAFNNSNLNEFLTFTNIRIGLRVPANLGLGEAAQGQGTGGLQEASAYYAISDIQITAR